MLITADDFFALPAYPLEQVVDPTGAGDTFAGGFVGLIASQIDRGVDGDVLRNAMAYGTALASFNVEQFGTEALGSDQVSGADVQRARRGPLAVRPLRPTRRRAQRVVAGVGGRPHLSSPIAPLITSSTPIVALPRIAS